MHYPPQMTPMHPMKKLLITLGLLACLSTQAADFTDSERRHFENQCRELAIRIYNNERRIHPNPKTKLNASTLDLLWYSSSPVNPLGLADYVRSLLETNDRVDISTLNHFAAGHQYTDYKWSDDNRNLTLVSSVWYNSYFSKVEAGETLKNRTIAVMRVSNIRLIPTAATLVDTAVRTDFPRVFYDEVEGSAGRHYFAPYTAHDGGSVINWDLYLDPDEMSPPFHGWFTWHQKNQLLAILERFPGFDLPFEETGLINQRTESGAYVDFSHDDKASLTVRHTRRKYTETWTLDGEIDFDVDFFIYKNMKKFRTSTFSYRTRSYFLKGTYHTFDSKADCLEWLGDNGGDEDGAREHVEKPWSMDVILPIATQYSGTRERIGTDNHQTTWTVNE